MKLSEIKIIDNGFGGVELKGIEPVKAVQGYFLDDIVRTRKSVLSNEVMEALKKLTYFYLNITGHWLAPFDKFIDKETYLLTLEGEEVNNSYMLIKDIWDKTKINKVKIEQASFSFSGTIETVEKKPISINTPKITMEDDFGFFDDAISKIQELWNIINEFVNSKALPEPERSREYIESRGSDKDKEEIVQMSDEEIMKKAATIFDSKGMVLLGDPGNKEHADIMEAIDGGEPVEEVVESGDIDSSRQEEAVDAANESFGDQAPIEEPPVMDEGFPVAEDAPPIEKEDDLEEIEVIPENKGSDFGPPASEGDFKDLTDEEIAKGNDLKSEEFSEGGGNLSTQEYD